MHGRSSDLSIGQAKLKQKKTKVLKYQHTILKYNVTQFTYYSYQPFTLNSYMQFYFINQIYSLFISHNITFLTLNT